MTQQSFIGVNKILIVCECNFFVSNLILKNMFEQVHSRMLLVYILFKVRILYSAIEKGASAWDPKYKT
jgi:hypothetical protein